ncbi:MAG: DUF1501 domain-containing protein [Planctomycetaceae bacterium]|nr:DUF1501 domain-containing protein [Planctomycetaceae bacterium]
MVTTLINELYNRGLDQKVLVIAAGEFDRTPKGTLQPGASTGKLQWGRDHGLVDPQNLMTTMSSHLRIGLTIHIPDANRRPIAINRCMPIRELT